MRITSGNARGISLESPKGDATRPATDAARQAVFSSLGDYVANARVLDLFAGTGSYGLEALSRGAKEAVFLEYSRVALACLKKNISAVEKVLSGISGARCDILPMDVFKAQSRLSEKQFDLIFADPPYAMYPDAQFLKKLFSLFSKISAPETIFVIEAPADFDFPPAQIASQFNTKLVKRLGKKSKGKPSQIIFKISEAFDEAQG